MRTTCAAPARWVPHNPAHAILLDWGRARPRALATPAALPAQLPPRSVCRGWGAGIAPRAGQLVRRHDILQTGPKCKASMTRQPQPRNLRDSACRSSKGRASRASEAAPVRASFRARAPRARAPGLARLQRAAGARQRALERVGQQRGRAVARGLQQQQALSCRARLRGPRGRPPIKIGPDSCITHGRPDSAGGPGHIVLANPAAAATVSTLSHVTLACSPPSFQHRLVRVQTCEAQNPPLLCRLQQGQAGRAATVAVVPAPASPASASAAASPAPRSRAARSAAGDASAGKAWPAATSADAASPASGAASSAAASGACAHGRRFACSPHAELGRRDARRLAPPEGRRRAVCGAPRFRGGRPSEGGRRRARRGQGAAICGIRLPAQGVIR